MKNRKDPKDKTDNNFVKRKESEQAFDTTASSTNTLTNTPTNTLTNTSSNNLTDTPSSHIISETKPPPVTHSEQPISNKLSDDVTEQAPSSNKPARPPLPRKKKLQRQNTLNEDSRPDQPVSTEPVSSDISVPTSGSSEYATACTSLSESGTQGYTSDTLRDVLSLPVVDEISEAEPAIEFRRSSFDLSKPTDLGDFTVRVPRRSASESEIFDLISPTPDYKDAVMMKRHEEEEEEELGEEEDNVVIRRVRSDLGTPGSSDTHVTQDTPTNEDDEAEIMETEEIPTGRPSTLSITDDALDMSANNTLSFVFTQPPKLFTVNVTGEQSLEAVSRSPKMTPEKRQGTSHDADDEVFEADNHDDRKDHRHHGDSDEEVVLQIERDHHPELNATPPSGGKKRKSRSESGECSDIPAHRALYDRIPAPEVTPLKLYSPPKAPKYSQNDVSPTSRLSDQLDPSRPAEYGEESESPPAIESHYEELNISNGTPIVSAVTVIVETDEEERSSEAAMSGGKKNKIRKQYSVHCDGKENLRVDNSPQHPRRKTSDEPGEVEVDSAMSTSEHYAYPRATRDNMFGDKVPGNYRVNSVKDKVPYKKAYSHPPHQDRNIMSLDLDEPPPSAPPQLQPSAPIPSPFPNRNSIYVHPDPVLYAEPNNIPGQPPPLPVDYLRRRFGEEQQQSGSQPPPLPSLPPARPSVSPGYHQTEAGYHQTAGPDQSQLYPTLSTELKNIEQDNPQKLSGTDSDEIVQIEPATTTAATPTNQTCGIQTRNARVNTDRESYHYASYTTDPKSKSWLMKIKKTFGIEKSASKKKMKVNVEKDNLSSPRHTTRTPSIPSAAQNTSLSTSPSVVRTRAEVTAHVMTSQPHTMTSQISHGSTQPRTPTAPQPTPEPNTVQYEPENKPSKQSDLYPALPTNQSSPPPPPPNLTPSQINTQIFGNSPAVPFPNAGIVPNVPFMWFPYGVPQPQAPGYAAPPLQQAPLPPSVPQLPLSESQASNRISKRKKMPESKEHDCIDPTLLSQDLIRHVKRSCGLNSSRSRTAARAIIQCLEDSISDTLKIQLLSELLTAMDTSYRSRRSQEQEPGRRKRTRALVEEEGNEVPRNHSCKKALREERILMKYLQQVLEILEEMSSHPDKENETFHMYFNLANRLLDTMYHKVANKSDPFEAS
ncbi:mucin-2-like isoform X2 [Bolinopsis microptera]|uniref:mucin-2-like isoform X2 n=1 Tax=Bolinopsis microptera TaxID=2820187 RepID=UPI003079CA93